MRLDRWLVRWRHASRSSVRFGAVLAGCAWVVLSPAVQAQASAGGGSAGKPLLIIASFSILADMAREVAGDSARVTSLAGPNTDPHAYQPSPADVQRLAQADLVIVNGLNFEGWLDRLVANADLRGRVVMASDGVEPRRIGTQADPHAWQSPAQGRHYVSTIEAAVLRALQERHATVDTLAAVRQRAAAYRDRIDQLDRDIRARLAPIPVGERRAITSHGAFGYLGRDYGINLTPLQAGAPESELSAGQLARVIRQVRSLRAVALFAENTSDRRMLQRVADEAGVAIGGILYSDALSPAGGGADTYLRLLAHNARTIADALQQAASASNLAVPVSLPVTVPMSLPVPPTQAPLPTRTEVSR